MIEAVTQAVPSGTEAVLEETVVLSRRDEKGRVRLFGTLALPDVVRDGHEVGVVTLHGWAGTRCGPHRIFVRLGRRLAQAGAPALRLDLSGRGESEGAAATTSLDDMIHDALAGYAFLREELGCRRIAFCGLCSGGNVAIGAATLVPTARLALLSTLPFSPRSGGMARAKQTHYLQQYLTKALSLATWKRLLRGEVDLGGVRRTLAQSGAESAEDRKLKDSRRDIMAAFAKTDVPALFAYGSADPEAAAAWQHYEQFCRDHRKRAEILFVDGANHNFYAQAWSRQVEDAVAAFLLGSKDEPELPPPARADAAPDDDSTSGSSAEPSSGSEDSLPSPGLPRSAYDETQPMPPAGT